MAVMLMVFGTVSASELGVSRVAAAAGVEDREPVGEADTFPDGVERVYCFSEVTGAGEPIEVTHVWYHGDAEQARVSLSAQGDRWRIWSSKRIGAGQTGSWRVVVEGPGGAELGEASFRIEGGSTQRYRAPLPRGRLKESDPVELHCVWVGPSIDDRASEALTVKIVRNWDAIC